MNSIVSLGLRPAVDLIEDAPLLRSRRLGMIQTHKGRLEGVHGRWWPFQGTYLQAWINRYWSSLPEDTCRLFFHEAWGSPGYLILSYIQSGQATHWTTTAAALAVLDEIARLKKSHAIVGHLTYNRISQRHLQRFGWESHLPDQPGKHVIRRFYGNYPNPDRAYRWMRGAKPTDHAEVLIPHQSRSTHDESLAV